MGWWAAGYITRTANSSWSARGYVRANTGANGRQGTCLSLPDDAVRRVHLDDGTYETHAAIVTGQPLHNGSAHREQICAILRDFGLDPPEVQPWDFADATGRSRWIKPD